MAPFQGVIFSSIVFMLFGIYPMPAIARGMGGLCRAHAVPQALFSHSAVLVAQIGFLLQLPEVLILFYF